MPMQTIRVRFATNRNRVTGAALFGNGFEGNDPKRYVTGSIDVVRTSNLPDTGWSPQPGTLVIDPPTTPLVANVGAPVAAAAGAPAGQTPATGIIAFAKEQSAAKTSATAAAAAMPSFGLVLLPGFASSFLDAMRRAAQIASAYKAANVFCFSWPANGKVQLDDYQADRVDAEKSGQAIADALAQFLATISAMPAAQRPTIHVVCHSMGAFAFRAAVQAIGSSHPDLIQTRAFEGALLMAADEDDDALSDPARLGPLLALARRTTAYTAGGDLALLVAQVVNGRPRMGHHGPRNLAGFPPTVTRIDCSDVAATQGDSGETHFSHQYYRLAPRVIADVVQVIAGKPPNQVSGRLADPGGSAGGRAFILPFDSGAGTALAAADPHPATVAALARAKAGARGAKRAGKGAKAAKRSSGTKTAKRNAATKARRPGGG
ncbi:MAG: alpha/beta hydrolase [Microvirga sp.]